MARFILYCLFAPPHSLACSTTHVKFTYKVDVAIMSPKIIYFQLNPAHFHLVLGVVGKGIPSSPGKI